MDYLAGPLGGLGYTRPSLQNFLLPDEGDVGPSYMLQHFISLILILKQGLGGVTYNSSFAKMHVSQPLASREEN